MKEPPKEFMEVVRRISATWTCCECCREFDNGPASKDRPYGEKIETADDGTRYCGGQICRDCMPEGRA